MRNPKRLLTALVFCCIAGCAASGPAYKNVAKPTDGSALLYVYRVYEKTLPTWKPAIVLDGKPQAKMQIGGHTLLTVEGGRHKLSVAPDNWKDDVSITFLAKPNSKRFFKLSTDVKNISTFGQSWTEVMRLTEIPEAQALKEISQTAYIAPQEVGENK